MLIQISRPDPALATDDPCQHEGVRSYSRLSRPYLVLRAGRVMEMIKRDGLAFTLGRAIRFFQLRILRILRIQGAPQPVAKRSVAPDEVLGLRPGEWVQVKSEAEIQGTLDAKGRHRGLQFTDEMRPFFGRQARVLKRVENIFLEESHQRRSLKNTVLLEGMHCDGVNFNCDRYCYLFWREHWLRRIDAPDETGPASSAPPSHGEKP